MVLVTSLKVIDGESGVSVLKIYRNTVLIKALASAGNFQIKKTLMKGYLYAELFG